MMPSVIRKANRAFYTRLVAGLGGFTAAALSLGLSLYDARTAGEISQAAVNMPVDTGRWKVTLQSASVAAKGPQGFYLDAGNKALVVNLTLENLSGESSNAYRSILKLKNGGPVSEPTFYLSRDHEILWDLQPMMPEAVQAVWQLPLAATPPDVLHVDIAGETFKPFDNLYAQHGWFPNENDIAWVGLPLRQPAPAMSGEAKP